MAERVTYIRLQWGAGVSRFQLQPPPPVRPPPVTDASLLERQLQSLRDAPPDDPPPELHDRERAIFGRLSAATWGSLDVQQTIFVGLCKGGEVALDRRQSASEGTWGRALELIDLHVTRRPLALSVALAQAILAAALYGVPEEVAEARYAPEKIVAAMIAEGA